MDAASLIQVLSRTLDPSQREEAEKQLEEVGYRDILVVHCAQWYVRKGTRRSRAQVAVCVVTYDGLRYEVYVRTYVANSAAAVCRRKCR